MLLDNNLGAVLERRLEYSLKLGNRAGAHRPH
jgi:hypothetical protein